VSREVAKIFGQASELSDLAIMVPGPIGTVAKVASLAFKAAKAFAEAGSDPVAEIKRMLSVIPEVAKVNEEFEAVINREFARWANRDVSSPSSSDVGHHATEPSMPAVTGDGFTPEDI